MLALTSVLLLSMLPLHWSFLPEIHPKTKYLTHPQHHDHHQQQHQQHTFTLQATNNNHHNDNNNHDDDHHSTMDWQVLHDRLVQCHVAVLETELAQPPHAQFTATDFCRRVLESLWDNGNPLPDAGFRILLRSSTRRWRRILFESVAAPFPEASEEVVASALGEALRRPQNQFAILVEDADDENDDAQQQSQSSLSVLSSSSSSTPPYTIEFPTDVVDYGDGTCWVECRLRGRQDGSLWVVMGWQLQRRVSDNAWLIHHMDWQDFRDQFRPGIGREEWMRICG